MFVSDGKITFCFIKQKYSQSLAYKISIKENVGTKTVDLLAINNVDKQLDAIITALLISESAQHVSGNILPILRGDRLRFAACGIMHPSSCRPVA